MDVGRLLYHVSMTSMVCFEAKFATVIHEIDHPLCSSSNLWDRHNCLLANWKRKQEFFSRLPLFLNINFFDRIFNRIIETYGWVSFMKYCHSSRFILSDSTIDNAVFFVHHLQNCSLIRSVHWRHGYVTNGTKLAAIVQVLVLEAEKVPDKSPAKLAHTMSSTSGKKGTHYLKKVTWKLPAAPKSSTSNRRECSPFQLKTEKKPNRNATPSLQWFQSSSKTMPSVQNKKN